MRPKVRLVTAAGLLIVASAATATQVLQDRIWYQSRAGTLHYPRNEPIALPPSERLHAMAMADSCPAIGGPRGVYRYMNGKLWLVGLSRCGSTIGLRDAYPTMLTPPVATWVSGVVVARLGRKMCTGPDGSPVLETEVVLKVDKGIVESRVEKAGAHSACAGDTGR